MYKNLLSSRNTINAGVPQEPVLGPLLFLIYVNDVSDKMLSMCRLFADDNSLQYLSKNIAEMECSINQDLNTLDKWSKQLLLQFNPNKTKAVFFTLRKKS